MVWKKEKTQTYKHSYWKKPSKPLHWNAKTRTAKVEDSMSSSGITPKHTKGIWIKNKGWFVDKKLAVEVKGKSILTDQKGFR